MRSSKTVFRGAGATLTAFAILLSIATAEAAGKKDAEATKLVDQAMNEDYLNVDLPAAETKLQKALKACGSDNCSPEVLGKVHVALATIHGLGQSKMDVAKSDFINALKADPNAKLIDGLTSPEFEATFKAAKAEAGGGAGGSGGSPGTGGNTGTGGQAPKPQGDFQHTPIAEGQINTPLPIFAEIPEEIGATKVIVRYKPYGGTKWESLPLKKMEGGFGALVPCDQVSSAGELRYYIIATDDQGMSLAGAGSMKDPFKVPVKSKIKGDVPSLPGQDPPKQCANAGECPPGLLGCGPDTGRGSKVEGMSCDATQECEAGLVCLNGVCAPGDDGTTKPPSTGGKKNLITLSAQLDFTYISDGTHVCDQASKDKTIKTNALANYTCANSDGTTFYGHPTNVKGTDGIAGGLGFAHARLLGGYDRILPFGLTVGARIGYYFLGPPSTPAPKGFVQPNALIPLHLELRGGWMLAKDGVKKGMIIPHAFVGGGYGSADASVPVTVCDADTLNDADGDGVDDNPKCPGLTHVDAYQLTGTGFIDFGGGATYMIVDNFGIQAEVKFMVMLPTTGFSISPVIAPVVAF